MPAREAARIGLWACAFALTAASCGRDPGSGEDPRVTTLGKAEVTARLVEIPEGAIFRRDLYDYATVLEYRVLRVHRGSVSGETILVAHYNPFKPRDAVRDRRVADVGGNLKRFEAGAIHRMALDFPLDDCYMGPVVNKYFEKRSGPIYWAVWTNLASAP